ncbi:hypothetical protein CSUB01_02031 [Colletotrichum sublineola]|uniref:Uncharacterized protein n=1 Tax=Colletotrichum sublineola TaxID=1173701 RepID=A0A066XXB3_COLSU|nr:hypothetical protein CSUB01_02031 [Colletotrichum sublineola]
MPGNIQALDLAPNGASTYADRDMPVSPRDANRQHEPFPSISLPQHHANSSVAPAFMACSIVMLPEGGLLTIHSSPDPGDGDMLCWGAQGTPAFCMNS